MLEVTQGLKMATAVAEVTCYRVDLPSEGGEYVLSGGRRYSSFPATVVRVRAEDGTCGYGEASTMGSTYMEGHLGSVEATVRELAPVVLKADVRESAALVRAMDAEVVGHFPAKSAIDIAMWDLRGRLLGVPVWALVGGTDQSWLDAFTAVRVGTLEERLCEAQRLLDLGYRRLQIKVGDDPLQDAEAVRAIVEILPADMRYLACDANRGWTLGDARRFLRAIADVDTYVEQPCPTTTELVRVRLGCSHPFVIDEAAKQPHDLIEAVALGCVEAMNLKPARVGGLTKASWMRDIAQAAGMKMTLDEPMGSHLATAGIAHFATSVDPKHLLGVSFFGSHETGASRADNAPRFENGRVSVPSGPGLGFVPGPEYLGEPVFSVTSTPRG